jgi:hypothetical protein
MGRRAQVLIYRRISFRCVRSPQFYFVPFSHRLRFVRSFCTSSHIFFSFIVRCPAPETFHGPVERSADRLGERELALRDCVDASGFSLHLYWNISVLQAHISRGCVDGLLFGAGFLYWTCYPHGLPLPMLVKAQQTAPPPPATSGTPLKPDNPVTTISPGGTTATLIGEEGATLMTFVSPCSASGCPVVR